MSEEFNLEKEISEISDPQSLRVILYLAKKVQFLEEKVAELSKDSSNSSKPPSSDITKPQSEQRQPGQRKRGGQKGRRGKARMRFNLEDIDRIEELSLSNCPDCGAALSDEFPALQTQQSVELPVKPVEVVEYRQIGKECPCCKVYHYPKLPEGVLEGQLFGTRLQALVGYMKGALGASYTELEQFCSDVLGITVSRGMLCNAVNRVSDALEVPYEELKESIPQQKQLNIDETSWRDSGKIHWVWVFCNQAMAFFTISPSRGSKVLKEVLSDSFKGAITTDFYSAYIAFANEQQQFCLAHLIRDIKFLTTLPDKETSVFAEKLLRYFRGLFKLWHKREQYSDEDFQRHLQRIKTLTANHLARSHLQKGKARTLQRRIIKRWRGLFMFTENQDLFQPTNNEAERTLRHIIRVRRQTQGSNSPAGIQWNERIATILETCKKQKKSTWSFLVDAILALNHNKIYPTLSAV